MHHGEDSGFLSDCVQIIEDIQVCQDAGKKVLLSLGGATPAGGQYIASKESAIDFAEFIWGAFGPTDSASVSDDIPRPFDSVVVDGFDFDIELGTDFGTCFMACF